MLQPPLDHRLEALLQVRRVLVVGLVDHLRAAAPVELRHLRPDRVEITCFTHRVPVLIGIMGPLSVDNTQTGTVCKAHDACIGRTAIKTASQLTKARDDFTARTLCMQRPSR